MEQEKEPEVRGDKESVIAHGIVTSDTTSTVDIRQMLIQELSSESFQSFSDYFHNNYKVQQAEFQKNPEKSTKARELAEKLLNNHEYHAEMHKRIWKLSSESVALAPARSEELALAYDNRAAVLLHLKKYEECIEDVNRGMAVTKTVYLQVKLLGKKMKCYLALNDVKMKKETWKMICNVARTQDEDTLSSEFISLVKQAKDDFGSSQSNVDNSKMGNEKIIVQCTQGFVSLQSNQNKERYYSTSRPYEAGEVVMCCKPYVTSINPNKYHAYCSHCLAFSWSGVPCDHCKISLYCSERCKEEAWKKYHEVECLIISYMQANNVQYYYYQMSVRAVLTGVQESGGIGKLRERIEKADEIAKKSKNFEYGYKNILENNFLALHDLPYKCSLPLFKKYLENACQMLTFIIHSTNFLKQDLKTKTGKELAIDKDAVFVTTLLLKITMIAACNASHINIGTFRCEKNKSLLDCFEKRCCSRGACIMPVDPFIKHDCNPNLGRCFTSDGKMIFYANQPLKKYKQIFASCFNNFYENDKDLRQKLLSKMYITCTCKACTNDWPVIEELFDSFQEKLTDRRFKQNALSQKLLPKYKELEKVIWNENYHADMETMKKIAVDVAEVRKICNQPSFLTSIITDVFCYILEDIYGDIDVNDEVTFSSKC